MVRATLATAALAISALVGVSYLPLDSAAHATEGPDPERPWWCAAEPGEWEVRVCHEARESCERWDGDCQHHAQAWCILRDNAMVPGRGRVCTPSLEECRHNRGKVPESAKPSACYPVD